MRRAAELARAAAEEASRRIEGRPLAAAHADVAWPAEPHLVLWHAQSILREYRGDGHIALLVVHGLSGVEALVTHAAAGDVPAHAPALDPGLAAGRLGRRGRRAARAGLARAGRRAPLDRVGPESAPGDRGRHRRTGSRALRDPRRTSAAPSCAPWSDPGARSSPNSCAEGAGDRPAPHSERARLARPGGSTTLSHATHGRPSPGAPRAGSLGRHP